MENIKKKLLLLVCWIGMFSVLFSCSLKGTAIYTNTSKDLNSINSSYSSSISSVDKNYYTITWENYDGTVLEIDFNVPNGTMPSYDGNIPQRESDTEYDYIFSGWTPTIVPVTNNATYTAQFDAKKSIILLQSISKKNPNLTWNKYVGDEGTLYPPDEDKIDFLVEPSNFTKEIYDIHFYSSDSNILRVDEHSGKAKCLNAGTCNVTYEYVSQYNTVTVTVPFVVNNHIIITDLMFSNRSKNLTIYDDNSETLSLEINPSSYDYNYPLNDITWTSSNPDIVSIFSERNTSAVIVAHNIPGTVTITASTKNGVSCSTTVTVKVTKLLIYDSSSKLISSVTMVKDESYMIKTNMKAKFKSLNPDVATIDEQGTIKALKSGVTNIEAESISNGTKTLLEVEVFDLTVDFPSKSSIDNYALYSTGQIGPSYANCNVTIADIYFTGGTYDYMDYRYPKGITMHARITFKKMSGLTGPHKLNVFIYNSLGEELEKETLKTNDIAVNETDEINATFCFNDNNKISYTDTLKIKLSGVAW